MAPLNASFQAVETRNVATDKPTGRLGWARTSSFGKSSRNCSPEKTFGFLEAALFLLSSISFKSNKLTRRPGRFRCGKVIDTQKSEGDIWNPKTVLQSDAIEEPFLVPQRIFQTRVLCGTISGSTKNLSNQGSLKNHFWFHKEPFKPGLFEELFS